MRASAFFAFILFHLFVYNADAGLIGSKAPGFVLTDVNETKISLEQFRGNVIAVVFWATWCVACNDEIMDFESLFVQYREKGFMVLGVNVDADVPRVSRFKNRTSISYPVLVDAKGHVGDSYCVTGIPTSFLISRDGIVRYRHVGYGKELKNIFEKEVLDLIHQ